VLYVMIAANSLLMEFVMMDLKTVTIPAQRLITAITSMMTLVVITARVKMRRVLW